MKIFEITYKDRFGWFILFGRGLKWKDTTLHPLLFSERNGYTKALTIGKWRISVLIKIRSLI